MKEIRVFVCSVLAVGLSLSCSSSHKSHEEIASAEFAPQEAEEIPVEAKSGSRSNFIATGAALTINDDGTHKFIRTAQLRFRVKTIPEATYTIEDIVLRNNGFILRSSINNENSYSRSVNVSADSALVTYYGNLVADIRLKVPRNRLDTVLKEIAPLAIEISYRTVEAQDVTLQILSDKLKQERLAKKQKRVSDAIDDKGRKLDDIIDAENTLHRTQEEADNALLSAYSLNEQIEYSTIDIRLYQNQTKYSEKVLSEKAVKEYDPGLLSKAGDSIKNGWTGLCEFLILMLNIWPVILILGIAVFFVLRYKKRKNPN